VIANNKRPYNSIIQIHVMRMNSLVACTCGGLYCFAEPLTMGFTLPRITLFHDHLSPLSCQRLRSPATLITWTSLLYMSLSDSLECQDTTLFESLFNYIHYHNTTIKSPKRLMELRQAHIIYIFSHIHSHFIPRTTISIQNIL